MSMTCAESQPRGVGELANLWSIYVMEDQG